MKAIREIQGAFDVRLWSGGSGPPLLYLHGFEQHPGAAPFLARLAEGRSVLAPEHPGYGSSSGFDKVEDIFIVDDDPGSIALMTALLEACGHRL